MTSVLSIVSTRYVGLGFESRSNQFRKRFFLNLSWLMYRELPRPGNWYSRLPGTHYREDSSSKKNYLCSQPQKVGSLFVISIISHLLLFQSPTLCPTYAFFYYLGIITKVETLAVPKQLCLQAKIVANHVLCLVNLFFCQNLTVKENILMKNKLLIEFFTEKSVCL